MLYYIKCVLLFGTQGERTGTHPASSHRRGNRCHTRDSPLSVAGTCRRVFHELRVHDALLRQLELRGTRGERFDLFDQPGLCVRLLSQFHLHPDPLQWLVVLGELHVHLRLLPQFLLHRDLGQWVIMLDELHVHLRLLPQFLLHRDLGQWVIMLDELHVHLRLLPQLLLHRDLGRWLVMLDQLHVHLGLLSQLHMYSNSQLMTP
jgi:hypothetical protein